MIKNTFLRLLDVTKGMFTSAYWIDLLAEGLSLEIGRLNDYRKTVYKSVIPNLNMDVDTLDDHLRKYGISYLSYLTDEEKLDFIIEAATLSGYSGPEWLQEQLQKVGFDFYVHENITPIDPSTVPGELVVGTHPEGGEYEYTVDSDYWKYYFFLSPYSDRLATFEEMPTLSLLEYTIFKKMIMALKFQRNWCVAQVNQKQYMDGSIYMDGSVYMDAFATPA